MKNIDQTPEEETLPREQRPTRRAPARRMPPPDADDVPLPSRRSTAIQDIRTRLAYLSGSRRFSQPVDLKLLAVTWANDFAGQVFPLAEGDQRLRLLGVNYLKLGEALAPIAGLAAKEED